MEIKSVIWNLATTFSQLKWKSSKGSGSFPPPVFIFAEKRLSYNELIGWPLIHKLDSAGGQEQFMGKPSKPREFMFRPCVFS